MVLKRLFPALFALAALGACALPAANTTTASARGYEDPTTGSLFGGGDRSGLDNGFNDPGLHNPTTNIAAEKK